MPAGRLGVDGGVGGSPARRLAAGVLPGARTSGALAQALGREIEPFDYVDADVSGRIPNATTWARPAAWTWLSNGGPLGASSF